jgi:hypothetical protein
MRNADEEMQAGFEQLQMIEEALDQCFQGKASRDDWLFIAWQTGAVKWTPPNNVIHLRRQG